MWSETRESLTVVRCPGTVANGNLYVLLVFNLSLCCRRQRRRDKPSHIQRYLLAVVRKRFANVYLRCLLMPFKWASSCSADFDGALGNLFGARGDTCEIPPPMCGGGLFTILGILCYFHGPLLQVLAWLGRSSMQPLSFAISRALNIQFNILLLVAVLCSMLSQAGCANEVRLRCHTLRAAPANAGLGLATLIG